MTTILLVDDDPLQAYLRNSILKSKYPDVQRVSDDAEALCLVEQPRFAENLGLVITGHHRSGISGPAFVAELQARVPALQVLVLGGTSELPGDYSGDGVYFRHGPIELEDLLDLTGKLLAQHEYNPV